VNLLEKNALSDKLSNKNSMLQVPSLEIVAGQVLCDSVAIIEWLDETYPDTSPLLPKDPLARQKCRELTQLIASGTQPLQNLPVLSFIESLGGSRQSWAKDVISKGLAAYESKLAHWQTEGPLSFGPAPTIADLCVVPQIYNALRFDVDLSKTPRLKNLYSHARSLPSCVKAAPEAWENI